MAAGIAQQRTVDQADRVEAEQHGGTDERQKPARLSLSWPRCFASAALEEIV